MADVRISRGGVRIFKGPVRIQGGPVRIFQKRCESIFYTKKPTIQKVDLTLLH